MAYENLQNDYTEVDTAGYLTLATTKVTAAALGATAAYVYKDFTASHFDALDVDFEIYSSSASGAYHYWGIGFSDAVNTIDNWGATEPSALIDWRTSSVTWIWLWRGPITAYDYWTAAADDTPYYCTMTRAAANDTITTTIYSDAVRTDLLDTLSVSGYSTDKWRYCYGFAKYNVTYLSSSGGYVDKIDLNEAVAGTNMQINIGDTWKTVTSAQINIGDTWKPITSIQINIGDSFV